MLKGYDYVTGKNNDRHPGVPSQLQALRLLDKQTEGLSQFQWQTNCPITLAREP